MSFLPRLKTAVLNGSAHVKARTMATKFNRYPLLMAPAELRNLPKEVSAASAASAASEVSEAGRESCCSPPRTVTPYCEP